MSIKGIGREAAFHLIEILLRSDFRVSIKQLINPIRVSGDGVLDLRNAGMRLAEAGKGVDGLGHHGTVLTGETGKGGESQANRAQQENIFMVIAAATATFERAADVGAQHEDFFLKTGKLRIKLFESNVFQTRKTARVETVFEGIGITGLPATRSGRRRGFGHRDSL